MGLWWFSFNHNGFMMIFPIIIIILNAGFPSHRGTPSYHPVVMDDHDFVLKQPWWRLGIPHEETLWKMPRRGQPSPVPRTSCCFNKKWMLRIFMPSGNLVSSILVRLGLTRTVEKRMWFGCPFIELNGKSCSQSSSEQRYWAYQKGQRSRMKKSRYI